MELLIFQGCLWRGKFRAHGRWQHGQLPDEVEVVAAQTPAPPRRVIV